MINWGVIGFGRMGKQYVDCLKKKSNLFKLKGVSSKSSFKNDDLYFYKSYEDLIKLSEIDAVYISTLNNTHKDLVVLANQYNKKILCEKPLGMNFLEVKELHSLLEKKKDNFLEAIAYRAHPIISSLFEILEDQEIGDIKKIQSNFGFKVRKIKKTSRLFNKELGGGSILDLGCYPISFFMLFTKSKDKISINDKKLSYAKSGVDDEATANLEYNNKFKGKIKVSIKSNLENSCVIHGTKGSIKVNSPWLPNKESIIEISNKNHFYIKQIKSNLSVYANQIENVSKSFMDENLKNNLFGIEKSSISMRLINDWMN